MTDRSLLWRRTIKVLALVVPVVLFVLLLPVNNSDDTRRIRDFYREEPNSLDVVFLGSSDVYAGFSPVLAYETFSFTSYPYVMSGNYAEMLPYQIQDVLSTQEPKLFVIEITEALNGKPDSYDHRLREYLDGLPDISRKHALIRQLGDPEQRLSYYSPFALYHGTADLKTLAENGRREQLVRRRGYSLLKGALTYTGAGGGEYVAPINTSGDLREVEILPSARENFDALLTWCREQGLENILFVTFPHRTPNEDILYRHRMSNAVGGLIRSYGYDYINLDCCLDDMGIQPETDYLDDEHLNLNGQYKNTRYLGAILSRDYGIGPSALSDVSRSRWDACVRYQHKYADLFRQEFNPKGEGIWLKENTWLLSRVEEVAP